MNDSDADQPVPEAMRQYVVSLGMTGEGTGGAAHLLLTRSGIELGRQRSGSHSLAQLVLGYARWHGTRSEANIASEIRGHCLTWRLAPPLRSAADPVDLEFTQPWPLNLVVSIRIRSLAVLRKLGVIFWPSHETTREE